MLCIMQRCDGSVQNVIRDAKREYSYLIFQLFNPPLPNNSTIGLLGTLKKLGHADVRTVLKISDNSTMFQIISISLHWYEPLAMMFKPVETSELW